MRELPVGVVFGRLRSGVDTPDGDGPWTWFGLWDVAARGTGLLATVATRRVGGRIAELCAVAVPESSAVRDRLLREMTDALRADGVERVVVTLPDARELLLRAGIVDDPATGLVLEL